MGVIKKKSPSAALSNSSSFSCSAFEGRGEGGDCCKLLAFFLAKMFGRRNVIDVLFQVVCVVNTAFERHHHPSASPNVFLISQTFQSLDVFTFCFSLSFWGSTDYIIWSSRPLLYINQCPRLPLGILLIVKKSFVMRQFQFAKVCQALHHVSQAHKEIKDNRHKGDIVGALIRKC